MRLSVVYNASIEELGTVLSVHHMTASALASHPCSRLHFALWVLLFHPRRRADTQEKGHSPHE